MIGITSAIGGAGGRARAWTGARVARGSHDGSEVLLWSRQSRACFLPRETHVVNHTLTLTLRATYGWTGRQFDWVEFGKTARSPRDVPLTARALAAIDALQAGIPGKFSNDGRKNN
jgi:hypothetical protein